MEKNLRPSIFKRLLALIVDFIILGVVGFTSGLFLEDFYVSLGVYGTLVGSSITILYFGILQSSINNGRSIGKMALGLKVTDLQGEYLTPGKSFLRAFIVFFPIMNAGIFSGGTVMVFILMLIILSLFATFYLILVNKSRRCLHDLLVASVVTFDWVESFEINEANDRSTKKLIPIFGLGVLMVGLALYQTFAETPLSQLLQAKEKIEQVEGVIAVNEITSGTTTFSSTSEPTRTYTSVKLTVRIDDINEASDINSRYFDDFYKIIRSEIPNSENMDEITITLYYGFNIGIASKTRSVTKTIERPGANS